MKAENLKRRIEKLGVKVTVSDRGHVSALKDGRLVSWFVQNGKAVCVKTRFANDIDDMRSGYSAGSYVYTLKNAVNFLAGVL